MREERRIRPTVAATRYAVPVNNNSHARARGRRELAVVSLLNSRTVAEAAENCNVGLRTLTRWLAEPEFQEKYRQAKEQALDGAINVLRCASTTFASGLVELALDRTIPPVVRMAACARGLEIVLRIYDHGTLERQVDELELALTRLEGEVAG